MKINKFMVLGVLTLIALAFTQSAQASTISWQGYTWTVKSGTGLGPGPNNWSANNVFVDANGYLHLQINYNTATGSWECAEINGPNLGFGTYQWQVSGRPDLFDPQVVLGLFSYSGPDGVNELDYELSRWGNPTGNDGLWTVYPASGTKLGQLSYNFALSGTSTTERFIWSNTGMQYWMIGGFYPVGTVKNVIQSWSYFPTNPSKNIPQNPMSTQINLWLDHGNPPNNGQPVEIIIQSFTFVPQ